MREESQNLNKCIRQLFEAWRSRSPVPGGPPPLLAAYEYPCVSMKRSTKGVASITRVLTVIICRMISSIRICTHGSRAGETTLPITSSPRPNVGGTSEDQLHLIRKVHNFLLFASNRISTMWEVFRTPSNGLLVAVCKYGLAITACSLTATSVRATRLTGVH